MPSKTSDRGRGFYPDPYGYGWASFHGKKSETPAGNDSGFATSHRARARITLIRRTERFENELSELKAALSDEEFKFFCLSIQHILAQQNDPP